MNVKPENLPATLRETGLFCCWKYETRPGSEKPTKVPYNPRTGGKAQSTNPDTFAPLDVALAGAGEGIGVGIFGTLGAIDIDHCIDDDGAISDMAVDIMATMNAYTERSPSGRGIRILFTAAGFQYDKARYYINHQKLGLEVYIAGCTNKYVTVTGNTFTPGYDLEERREELAAVLERYMVRPTEKAPPVASVGPSTAPDSLDDLALIEKAKRGKGGAAFAALWAGSTDGYNSHSEADLALCNALAWWCNGDAARVDRLFRMSGLMRDKWDRKQSGSTYGAITVKSAVAGLRGGYDPARPGEGYALDWDGSPDTGDKPPEREKRPILRPMDTVEARRASYLISPYLPKGMLAVMGGVSGAGKTYLILSWAAAISNGQRLPFQTWDSPDPPRGYVYYFTRENDPNTVIRPRLDQLGADLERVLILNDGQEPLTMNDPRLDEAAKDYPPALVIFDPIQSYLGAGVEMNKANEVRPILDWLGDYAKRNQCTVVLVSHMSKPGVGVASALDRLLGSSDFRNVARSIIVVGRDPNDKESRVFAHGKNSIGEPGESQRYHIDGKLGVIYDGPCELTADDIIKAGGGDGKSGKPAVTLTAAVRQLDDLLGEEGAATLEQVETLQTMMGISHGTLSNARKELGLKSVSIGQPPKRMIWWVRPDVDVKWFKLVHTPGSEQIVLET